MNFPTSKDTWTRKKDRDLSIGEIGDRITKGWYGDWADWLEAFQDLMGYDFRGGYASLKARLDAKEIGASGERLFFGIAMHIPGSAIPQTTGYVDYKDPFIFDDTYYSFTGMTSKYRLEASMSPNVVDGGVVMQLYDVTASSAVSGSEVSKTGSGVDKYLRMTSGDIDLVDGHEYKVQFKLPAVDKWGTLYEVKICSYGVKT